MARLCVPRRWLGCEWSLAYHAARRVVPPGVQRCDAGLQTATNAATALTFAAATAATAGIDPDDIWQVHR